MPHCVLVHKPDAGKPQEGGQVPKDLGRGKEREGQRGVKGGGKEREREGGGEGGKREEKRGREGGGKERGRGKERGKEREGVKGVRWGEGYWRGGKGNKPKGCCILFPLSSSMQVCTKEMASWANVCTMISFSSIIGLH